MKKSKEWVRFADLEKKLDRLVETGELNADHMTTYDAAKALGAEPNGEFYRKVREWRQARRAAGEAESVEVPAAALAAFREALDQFGSAATDVLIQSVSAVSAATDVLIQSVSAVGVGIQGQANLEIRDAVRRADESQAELGEVTDRLCQVEEERDAAVHHAAELTAELGETRDALTHLQGRLEANERIVAAFAARAGEPSELASPELKAPGDADEEVGPDLVRVADGASTDRAASSSPEVEDLLPQVQPGFSAADLTAVPGAGSEVGGPAIEGEVADHE